MAPLVVSPGLDDLLDEARPIQPHRIGGTFDRRILNRSTVDWSRPVEQGYPSLP